MFVSSSSVDACLCARIDALDSSSFALTDGSGGSAAEFAIFDVQFPLDYYITLRVEAKNDYQILVGVGKKVERF
jgi:hypothetical protein